jgi:hypothetical protein
VRNYTTALKQYVQQLLVDKVHYLPASIAGSQRDPLLILCDFLLAKQVHAAEVKCSITQYENPGVLQRSSNRESSIRRSSHESAITN